MTAFPVTGPQTITFTQGPLESNRVIQGSASQQLRFEQTLIDPSTGSAFESSPGVIELVPTEARGLVIPSGITIKESIESRNLEQTIGARVLTRVFHIIGTDDPVRANGLGPQIGDSYNDSDGNPEGVGFVDQKLIARNRRFGPLSVGGSDSNEKAITLQVIYRESNFERQATLDITGESRRINRAFSQQSFPVGQRDKLEKEWGKAIGPRNKENEIQGVDRLDTAVAMTETHERDRLAEEYIVTLLTLHGKVNSEVFRGYAKKTVLFRGVRARTIGDGRWELEYQFSISPFVSQPIFDEMVNDSGTFEPGGDIVIRGWDYFWLQWDEQKDPDDPENKKLIKVITSAHIATIYEESDYNVLGIGLEPLRTPPIPTGAFV